jgi:predicted PurR-regulated permease PerM
VVGVGSFVGLEILAVVVNPVFGQYAVLLALIAGVLELVPFIGPIIAAIPAVLIGLTVGPGGFFAALILYLLIQQVENNVLVPKIQGDAVELHPSAVMLALVVGASLAGVLGAIISLPVAAAGRDVFRYLFKRVSEPPASVREALTAVSPKLLGSVRPSALADDPA